MNLFGTLFRSTDWKIIKLWGWMSIWIFLILLKASLLNIKGEKVKKRYTHTYFHFVRPEFCSTCTMSHAKKGRKWWQEPENWAQAMLCTPSCRLGALHEGPWGHEKCNITGSNLLYIGQAELPCALNHFMHMLILASNFIWQCIK